MSSKQVKRSRKQAIERATIESAQKPMDFDTMLKFYQRDVLSKVITKTTNQMRGHNEDPEVQPSILQR